MPTSSTPPARKTSTAGSVTAIWLNRFSLPFAGWREALRHEARERPFSDAPTLVKQIGAFFRALAATKTTSHPERTALREAWGWALLQAWQSGSHFPSFAEDLAAHFEIGHQAEQPAPPTLFLARLLVPDSDARCGEQPLLLAAPDIVRESEKATLAGHFDGFRAAKIKYEEISTRVSASPAFRRDWRELRRVFPTQTRTRRLLHRSRAPERNWVQPGDGLRFDSEASTFQACLDLLCWKYCLWAIAPGGRPMVLKPSVTITPWGTQIFIPSYLSIDLKRDLDVRHLSRLHRARGVARQGEHFAEGRRIQDQRRRLALAAAKEARNLKLKGERRLAFIAERAGLGPHWDERTVRRLVAKK